MVASFPLEAGRCAPAADQAGQAAEATQAPAPAEATEEVMSRMTATVAAMNAVARRAPVGRAVALAAVGLVLIAAGIAGPAPAEPAPVPRPATEQEERAYEVRRLSEALDELAAQHTPQSQAAWSEPAPASSTSAGAGRQLPPLSRAGGAAQVAGPAVHSTTPAVGGERAVFRGSAP